MQATIDSERSAAKVTQKLAEEAKKFSTQSNERQEESKKMEAAKKTAQVEYDLEKESAEAEDQR